jgi:hypothetical protein
MRSWLRSCRRRRHGRRQVRSQIEWCLDYISRTYGDA